MKFLKSKMFLILLSVALVLTVIPATLSAMGHTGLVRNAFMTVTFPVRWVFNTVARGFAGFSDYFTEYNKLKDENDRLRRELESAKEELDRAEVALDENEWLRKYFGIADEKVELKLLGASVVGYESGNTDTVYTLDRGSIHGVTKHMAVITESGVVGCVTEVGLNWCKITSIIEDSVAAGAYIDRTGDHGIVKGDYGMRASGTCLMSGINAESGVKVGDRVSTSGIGSVYPRGIPIGEVVAVIPDPASRTLTAKIRPYTDFSDIKKVMIVTGHTDSMVYPDSDQASDNRSDSDSEPAGELTARTGSGVRGC